MVLDGVTLTMPPPTLTGRQKHAAQRITSMWLRKGEAVDPDVHTFNRYGVQLGAKVPLWGGFSGGGRFTLRLWTPRPKMLKADWEAKVPALKRAVDAAEARAPERRKRRHFRGTISPPMQCCVPLASRGVLHLIRIHAL